MVLDELHSLVISKRGHLLALGLARLRRLQPKLQTIGLSATVAQPDELRRWLVEQDGTEPKSGLVTVDGGAKPEITILDSAERVPWAGHSSAMRFLIFTRLSARIERHCFCEYAQSG